MLRMIYQILDDKKGDTNLISITVIITIVIVFAILFLDPINSFIQGLF